MRYCWCVAALVACMCVVALAGAAVQKLARLGTHLLPVLVRCENPGQVLLRQRCWWLKTLMMGQLGICEALGQGHVFHETKLTVRE